MAGFNMFWLIGWSSVTETKLGFMEHLNWISLKIGYPKTSQNTVVRNCFPYASCGGMRVKRALLWCRLSPRTRWSESWRVGDRPPILSFIHTFMHACIHSFMHAFIHPFIHPFISCFLPSFIHWCLFHSCSHWLIDSCIHSFLYSFIDSFIQILTYSFIGSCIHAVFQSFILSFIPFLHLFVHWFSR